MKKILFYTPRDITDPSLGINKKIINQIRELRKTFYVDAIYRKNDANLILEKHNGKEVVLVGKMNRPYKVEASRWLAKFLKKKHYDGCYIRYVFSDMQFIRALKCLDEQDTQVIVEIPAYPYNAELSNSLENRIVLLLDKLYRNKMKPYVDRIVTYSKDKSIYGIPAVQVVNGVDFDKISAAVHEEKQDSINIIAVANLAVGHGYDRLLRGMGEYYQHGGTREIHFYQVGVGTELELYRKIVEEYHIHDKVTFCGVKDGKELDSIYDKCTLAAECLGPHRQGIKLSSSLKSREYSAKGLPMLTAVDIDIFNEDCPYICKVSADETPIDMEKVISFYDNLYAEKNCNEIADEIRSYARKLCDMEAAMKPVIDIFNSCV